MEHKKYTKEEVEKFMEDNFIDFEDEEIHTAIETIATNLCVTLEDVIDDLANEDKEQAGELVIRIKLLES